MGWLPAQIVVVALILVGVDSQTSYYDKTGKSCGILHSEKNFGGKNLTFVDTGLSLNLAEEYRGSASGWNGTGSVTVESGCQVAICNHTYFEGRCVTLTKNHRQIDQLLDDVGSVNCTCTRECKCSDIYMKKSSCARAYLKGGCSTCNAQYLDLRGSKSTFSDDFVIQAFRLRKGCKLTVYSDWDHKGEATLIDKEINESFQGEIGSYKCECNDDEWVPRPPPAGPPGSPPMIDLPSTLDDVIKMLRGPHQGHPGLLASYKSLVANGGKARSSRNAYILLLGTTGSGKSSVTNILFDNDNVTKVGDATSTTTDIHEFRIRVPVDEFGIRNSELRVIDTPGLSDTRGVEHDAKFLATLEDYLSSHSELKNRIPNVVMILHNFHDNRFDGSGSNFVRMLRAFNSLTPRITDDNFSNVVFVFSHFCRVDREDQRNPGRRLLRFKKVIENFSHYPKPLIMAVAENKAASQDLPMVNGYFKLPNNEYFPHNLYEKMELITGSSGDAIGQAVFREAFRDSENFNITHLNFKLLPSSAERVNYYLNLLKDVIFNIDKTEVTELLAMTFNSMDSKLQRDYPHSLHYLQKSLNLKGIAKKTDVPKTPTEVLNLLNSLNQNEATRWLLEKGLEIKTPPFPTDPLAGRGYHILNDAVTTSSPVDLGENRHSDIGFLVPKALTCRIVHGLVDNFQMVDTMEAYSERRLKDLGIGKVALDAFKGTVKPGYNIKNSSKLTASREVRQFQLELNDDVPLRDDFKNVVKALGRYDQTNPESVNKWETFFREYGTHVVHSAFGGGAADIEVSGNLAHEKMAGVILALVQFEEDLPGLIDGGQNQTFLMQSGVPHELRFHGGDAQYHAMDLTRLSIDTVKDMMSRWRKSLKVNPVMLTSGMRLLPISQLVKNKLSGNEGQQISAEIERVAEILFKSNLKVTLAPPPTPVIAPINDGPRSRKGPPPPPPREATPFMMELIKLLQDNNKQMQTLMLDIKRLAEENLKENRRRQDDRDKHKQEEDRKNHEFHLKMLQGRDEAAARREQWQREWLLSQQKAAAEENRREREYQERVQQAREASDRRMQEFMLTMAKRPDPPARGSCLKKGTKILMADSSLKSVESLKIGDFVMDISLSPTKVLGVAHEFLLEQKFYGFERNSQFFTESHLFVGPNNTGSGVSLFAKNPDALIAQNPLMKYLNVSGMESGNISLFHLQQNGELEAGPVQVYEDPSAYPKNTKIYFIQVDNPLGTYIANGYVCRHEVPPVYKWPNTMGLLFQVLKDPAFHKVAELPYTVEDLPVFDGIVADVRWRVEVELEVELRNIRELKKEGVLSELMTLELSDIEESIGAIFGNPALAAVGVGVYAKVGNLVAPYLDEGKGDLSLSEVARLQHSVKNVVINQLHKSISFRTDENN